MGTLARGDVERYLDSQAAKLERVRRALVEDAELWTLMDTPLMLTVLFLASAVEAEGGTTEPDARRRLYGRYVNAMFERPRKRLFPREKALRWLGWLAAQLSNRNQIPFALEDLDPSWLPSRRAQRAAEWVGRLVLGLVLGLVFGLVGGLVGRLVGGPVGGLVGGLGVGLGAGLVLGLGDGLGVGIGLGVGLFFGLFLGLDAALRPAPVGQRSAANEGTRRSLRYALYIASVGPVFLLVLTWGYALRGVLGGALPWMVEVLALVAPAIVVAGVLLGLRKGGYFAVRHGVVRALLRRLNLAPWAYVSFLDEAKDHLFLRKTGGVYQFFHVTFRDFMAETYGAEWLAEPPPPDPATLAADAP